MPKTPAMNEIEKILDDLSHGSSRQRWNAISKLAQLEESNPEIVNILERVVLFDPSQNVQDEALAVLNLPQYKRVHRRLSLLSEELRPLLPDEIDSWAKAKIITSRSAELLKLRLGFGEIPEPIPSTPPDFEQVVEAAQPLVSVAPAKVKPIAGPAPPLEQEPAPPPPPKEKVPFDQWLLSERNIKIALYAGGALLVLAGIIFISVNWMRIPGPVKFMITLMVTGLMYLGGYLMFSKPQLRIGGTALIGVASGFLPLNFAVLQIYVLSQRGLADEVMWLIASPMCLLLYMLTAYWTKGKVFTFISLAAVISTVSAALLTSNAQQAIYGLTFALVIWLLLFLARIFHPTTFSIFTYLPLKIVAHVAMPLVVLFNFVFWISTSGCLQCWDGSPWLGLIGFATGILFYVSADRLFKSRIPRWVATFLSCMLIFMVLIELESSSPVYHYALLVVPLAYLGIGYTVERREKKWTGALPLYIIAGLTALIGTIMAVYSFGERPHNPAFLARALFLDVLLLLGTEFLLSVKLIRWLTVFVLPVAIIYTLRTWHFNSLSTVVTLMVVALAYLCGGYALKRLENRPLGSLPLYIAAYVVALFSTIIVIDETLPLMVVLYLDVLLLIATNILLKRIEARWVAAFLFVVPIYLSMDLLDFNTTAKGITLMILSLVYLLGGYSLERWEKREAHAWPLYAAAYCVALLVTWQATQKTKSLIEVLFGDVVLLVFSAGIHRIYWWVYGAAWLFMLPIYLLINLFVPALPNQGLLMGVLGLNYATAGYALGKRSLRLGAPFLSCAAFLTIVAVFLSWFSHPTASVVLAIVAALYLLASMWIGWHWLLPVTWLAVNLLSFSLNSIFFQGISLAYALVITYALLGAALLAGAYFIQRKVEMRWSLPIYITGTINLVGAFIAALILGGWLAVCLSALMAIYLLSFAWLMCAWIRLPILTYLGLAVVAVGYFFAIGELGGSAALDVFPVYAAILCCLFVFLAWLFRREPLTAIYSQPLRYAGLFAMIIPMMGTAFITRWWVFVAVTFGMATFTYLGDAALRKVLNLVYIGLGALVATIWAILGAISVREPQAYVFTLAIALLALSWKERTRQHRLVYRIVSLLALVLLMGTAYYQSLVEEQLSYAILLLVETLLSLAFGIWQRKRIFVQAGGIALLVNAGTQFGPGFVELDRWIQIAVIGSLLFGLGLSALFKRQDILSARQKLTDTWRQWES